GANSSFVAIAADSSVPVERLLRRPAHMIGSPDKAPHPKLPLPRDLYQPQRLNSKGVEFGERAALEKLPADGAAEAGKATAAPLVDGRALGGASRDVISPIDMATVAGSVTEATREQAEAAVRAAKAGFAGWSAKPASDRAHALDRAAELLGQRKA